MVGAFLLGAAWRRSRSRPTPLWSACAAAGLTPPMPIVYISGIFFLVCFFSGLIVTPSILNETWLIHNRTTIGSFREAGFHVEGGLIWGTGGNFTKEIRL